MHHHYLTIEQREALERIIRERMGEPKQLRNALERLHSLDYGVCIECGKDIDFAHLREDPESLHCRACRKLPITTPR